MKRRKFIKSTAAGGLLLSSPLSFSSCLSSSQSATDITAFSAIDLSAAIQSKQLSCIEVMQAYLARIHQYNPVYNAIVSMVDDDTLLEKARQADVALANNEYWGWMHGMPHAIKDLAAVKGMVFTQGSPMFAKRIADEDDEVVARIRSNGAIFIGKTNTPEFGLGSQSYNPVFGATGSAYDPQLTAGGSSGGAACGLATHMLPAAEGGDMMGSLRNPGAFNNVIGFRPSTNVMNDEDADFRHLWTKGPMGRNTADTIQLLQTIAPRPSFNNVKPLALKDIKLGWLADLNGYLAMESGIIDLCESSLNTLANAGAAITPLQPQFEMSDLWLSWTTLRHSGRDEMMQYYDDPKTRDLLKPELIWEIEQSLQLDDNDREEANGIRARWYTELERMFKDYDFLVLPTAQVFPFSKDIHWPKQINTRLMDTYHRWMEVVILGSLGGLPVVNVPVGFDDQGRPMGMQIMGKFGDDRRVLEFALAYEEITDYLNKRPKLIATE